MAEKKYYWLKLKNDFFTQPKIKKLRRIAGGDTYTLIYLKLQLLSLQHEGVLLFDGVEDSFVEELALTIDETLDNVQVTVQYLISQGLLEEVGADTLLLPETVKNIGSETRQAEAMRRKRALDVNNVTPLLQNVTQSKSKELDKEKDIELKKDTPSELPKKSPKKSSSKETKIEANKNLVNTILDEYEGVFSEKILEAVFKFFAERIDKGEKITETQVQMQVEDLKKHPTLEIIPAIEAAIMRGYKGIFFSENKKSNVFVDTASYTQAEIEELKRNAPAHAERAKKRLQKYRGENQDG